MTNIKNKLSPSVNKLIKSLKVKLLEYSDIKQRDCSFDLELCKARNEAFYDPINDWIGLNVVTELNVNSLVLHELIHWTGHKKRLNRKHTNLTVSLLKDLENSKERKEHEKGIDTEEVTAQIGMFKVALVLGLNPAEYSEIALEYIKHFPKANFKKVEIDSDKAVDYLMSFIKMKKVAWYETKSEF